MGLALVACGSDPAAQPENACPGAPPTLDDCFVGRNYAECGGTAGPVFACSQQGDCRWFLAGCTPADYRRSSCPADDVCCIDDFPFDARGVDDQLALGAFRTLYGNGTLPWNRTDNAVIPVEVDPASTATTTQLTCDGWPPSGDNPCLYQDATAWSSDVMRIDVGHPGLWGRYVELEIDPLSPPVARACEFQYTDVIDYRCPPFATVHCATSGSIVVNSVDDAVNLQGTLDLTFEGGATLSGSFVTP